MAPIQGLFQPLLFLNKIKVETHRSVPCFPWVTEVTPGNLSYWSGKRMAGASAPMQVTKQLELH